MNRRALLRGAGATALAFPFVGDTRAWGAGGFAKRLIVFFSPNGMEMRAWRSTGGERDFVLGRTLKPLEPFRNDIIVLEGLRMASGYDPAEKVDHDVTTCNMLTGVQIVGKKEQLGGPGIGVGGGISVDQYILDNLPGPKLPSRHLGANVWEKYGRISFRGRGQPIFAETDPRATFASLFSGVMPGGGDPAAVEKVRAQKRSLLDAVRGDLKAISGDLCGEDRRKLELHADSLRALELRIDSLGAGVTCAPPAAPPATDDFVARTRLQMDNLVMAMACGLTRVATFLPGNGSFNQVFTWIPGIKHGAHSLKHRGADVTGLTGAQIDEQLTLINIWWAELFAELLKKLKAIPEPGQSGSMLDHSVVLWTTEHANGAGHDMFDMPYVLAGRAGGYLQTGRLLRHPNQAHNAMLVSLCHAMGLDNEVFGDPKFGKGPLASLRG